MAHPERVLLDTHVLIALSTRPGFESLPRKVQRLLQNPQIDLLCSIVSYLEIAIKHSIGKLDFPQHEVTRVLSNAGIRSFLPLNEHHAAPLFDLPLHHRDPFDRAIIAAALAEDLPLLSQDAVFRQYQGLQVIW